MAFGEGEDDGFNMVRGALEQRRGTRVIMTYGELHFVQEYSKNS